MSDLFREEADLHDPGGKVRLRLQPGVIGKAYFSPCRRYRHQLIRQWVNADAPYALIIGMNPSTAEADVDDPTIRKEISYVRNILSLGALVKCNVMDYRATSPRDLLRTDAPCSRDNLGWITSSALAASKIIIAHGKLHKSLHRHARAVTTALSGLDLWCFGTNGDGSPKHPLYLKGDTPLVRYAAALQHEAPKP